MKKIEGFNCFVLAEEQNGYYLVTHKELKRKINELNISYVYSFPKIDINTPMITCLCEMTNKENNRTVAGIGEINSFKFLNEKEKTNLIKTVARRAFDKAAIEILGFKESVYPYLHGFSCQTKNSRGNAKDTGRPLFPDNIPDVLLTGSLKGQKYSEIKDSEKMTKYIKYLKENSDLEYDDKVQAQVDFLRGLSNE